MPAATAKLDASLARQRRLVLGNHLDEVARNAIVGAQLDAEAVATVAVGAALTRGESVPPRAADHDA